MTEAGSGRLDGRTILITGATRGIGQAAATELAIRGARVIVHGRNSDRVARTEQAIRQKSREAQVEGVVADLSSLRDVRRLAKIVNENYDRLDVLVNNAGLVTRKREETADGFERQLAVNHLAPFLLTNLLLDKLKANASARIVTVASGAHRRATFDRDDINWERRRYSGIGAYSASKLANILFTRELARRLQGTSVTANCLHPGVVATNIFTGMGLFGTVFGLLSKPLMLSAHAGARTSVYLSTADEVSGISGRYFSEQKLAEPSPAAQDDRAAGELWQLSVRMTGLTSSLS